MFRTISPFSRFTQILAITQYINSGLNQTPNLLTFHQNTLSKQSTQTQIPNLTQQQQITSLNFPNTNNIKSSTIPTYIFKSNQITLFFSPIFHFTATLSIPIEQLSFESTFKLSRKTFSHICSLVHEEISSKKNVHYLFTDGTAMATEDLVAVALRRFGSGDSLVNVGTAFGTNHSTVSQVTWRFVEAMEKLALRHISWPAQHELQKTKNKFEKMSGLTNCCGAVGATPVLLCLPSGEPHARVWMDGERNHSMAIQVIVDADMKFRDMITGWPGSMNEFQILKSSNFYKLCESGARLQNYTELLEGSGKVREYIVGDSSYPLLPWLITPYQNNNNNNNSNSNNNNNNNNNNNSNNNNNNVLGEKLEFNKRHLVARNVATRALSRFKEMWRFFEGEMWRPDKHKLPRMILVCGMIHNIIIDLEGENAISDDVAICGNVHKSRVCEFEDRNGVLMRDVLARYLSDKKC